jgi:hypothetical protein
MNRDIAGEGDPLKHKWISYYNNLIYAFETIRKP